MYRWAARHPIVMLSTGLTLGLAVGVGMMVGALVTVQQTASTTPFPPALLDATATHGGETMAMATGVIDDGTEGVFFLDFVTGELQCHVLNRRTYAPSGLFKHNVVADLGIEQGKKPSYLIATGMISFVRGGSNVTLAESLIYVADANTGRYVAYGVPWNRSAAASNQGQSADFVVLSKGSVRNIPIRGQ